MIEARRTAAHVWTSMEADFERVEQVRQRHKAAYKEAEGFSLTYLPFIARATIDALARTRWSTAPSSRRKSSG